MAGHVSYEDQKKLVVYGLKLLGAITIIEVLIALLAKGHLIHGVHFTGVLHYIYMAVIKMKKLCGDLFVSKNFITNFTNFVGSIDRTC